MQENNTESIVPGVSFSKKQGMIMVFRTTIQALLEPDYIRFLINMEKGRLAIQACDKKTVDCFKVPAYDPKDWAFRIYSDMMQKMLWRRCGWDDECTYRVNGVLPPEFGLVEFDLNTAEKVADSQTG